MKSEKPSVHFPRLVSVNEPASTTADDTAMGGAAEEAPEKFDTFFNSANRLVMGVTISIIVGFVALLIFSAFAPINRGSIANGQITVLGQRNLIQHLDGGVVQQINIKEGDHVRPGELLVKLDDRPAKLALQLLQQQQRQLLIEQAMLQSERAGAATIAWPPEVLAAAARDPATARSLATNQILMSNRRSNREAQKAVLREQNTRLQAQIAGFEAQKQGLAEQARLIKLEADSLTQLYDKGLTTRTRILALQRNAADLQGSIGASEAQMQQNRVQMGENNLRMIGIDTEMQEQNAKRLTELQTQLFELGDRVSSQQLVLERTAIRSPSAGVVLNRVVNSVGMVVRPGEPIVEIVPDNELIVTAQVRPQDIERVKVGATAVVRMSSLNVQTTPRLHGKVVYVSADALTDEKAGRSYFTARVEVPRSEMKKMGPVKLQPGMPAEVMIDAGSRTVLSYLLQPVTAAFGRAFTE
jgi:HlyD family type I secretion membrane fusion protein